MEVIAKADFTLLKKLNNRNFLFNTLYGTLDEIDDNVSNKFRHKCGFNDTEEKYLMDRKHLQQLDEPQYDEYLSLCKEYVQMRNRPVQFFIPLTLDCNLSCTYCFQKDHRKKIQDLKEESLNHIIDAIKAIKDQGAGKTQYIVVLYGGEPLLSKNTQLIDKIIDMCIFLEIEMRIITNGINLSLFIEKFHELSHILSDIVVTVDGSKQQHDAVRIYPNGGGTYEKIIENLRILKENGLPVTVRINLTESSIRDLNKARLELSSLCDSIMFYRVNHKDYSKNVSFKKIFSLLQKNKLKVEQIGINPIKYFYYLINDKYNSYPLYRYCDSEFIYLFSLDGKNIYHCNEAEDNNLFAGTYNPLCLLTDKEQREKIYQPDKCKQCEMLPICGGGCPFQRDKEDVCCYYGEITKMIDGYIKNQIFR